jgi:hypothetical protein
VLYPSHVLLARPSIEPITEHIPDQTPLKKAQRLDRQAYESPALPLSYSATAADSIAEPDVLANPGSLWIKGKPEYAVRYADQADGHCGHGSWHFWAMVQSGN